MYGFIQSDGLNPGNTRTRLDELTEYGVIGSLVALAAAMFSCLMISGYFCGARLRDSCVTNIVPAANTSGGNTAGVGGGDGWADDGAIQLPNSTTTVTTRPPL